MENEKKEVYTQPALEVQGLLRDITTHCASGQIDVFQNGCHAAH